ncbi:MAG: CYTH domain-containing protein [Acaryochloris sp. RU_4_1]|nr:CYTH domain-containing protein [Acaryochloris sp. RU_4_1]NJR55325.1 CYTH domain-containing protein [Acaryochloris sp. CRU_2_0]
MGIEIERKFLVKGEGWRWSTTDRRSSYPQGTSLIQGYLASHEQATVRVRIAGDLAYLTVKGKVENLARPEFEYAIPVADAQGILQLCGSLIVAKTRYKIPFKDLIWEVDEFVGANQGLVLAEVELQFPDQPVSLPGWIGTEVSEDSRYFNSYLARHPYSTWSDGLDQG